MDSTARRIQDAQAQNDAYSRSFKTTLGDMCNQIPQGIEMQASNQALPFPLQTLPNDFEEAYMALFTLKTKFYQAQEIPAFEKKKKYIEKYIEKIEELMHSIEIMVKNIEHLTIDNGNSVKYSAAQSPKQR